MDATVDARDTADAADVTDVTVDAADATAHVWCDRCGQALADGRHEACRAARRLEPPRYCGLCRRRMKVQVLPAGWRASCVEHGSRSSS